MSFKQEYNTIIKLVEEEINSLNASVKKEIHNSKVLKEELTNYINSPSKHIRATLVFLSLKAMSIPITEEQITLQTIVELVHNASLIHDDVIDDSELRRGKSSFNKALGNHMSVIAGDYILSFALKKLVELKSFDIIRNFANTIENMCQGEIEQQLSKYKIPTIENYITKTYNKTGSLFETAMTGSLILANSNERTNLKEFAKNFGISFQIRDDIQNIINNKTDSDIKNGIYTAAVIYSQDANNPTAGIEKAKILLDTYTSKAKSLLNNIPENQYKEGLIKLLDIINNE